VTRGRRSWLLFAALPLLACVADGNDDDAGPQTQILWQTPPPDSVTAGDPLTAAWTVETEGEVHVAQLRACMGEVPTCGVDGDDLEEYANEDAGTGIWTAALTLPSAGTWTVVAWAHVDEDPHLSEPVTVVAE
jgi:hypothetical protein